MTPTRALPWIGALVAAAAGCGDEPPGPVDDDTTAGADDDSTPIPDDDATSPPDDDVTADDDTTASPLECFPLSMELVQQWYADDLPAREPGSGVWPGIGVGDLDGDGWLDVLFGWAGGSKVLLNDGAGRLVFSESLDVGGAPLPSGRAVHLADLDGDGDLDAVLGRFYDKATVVLRNDGSGLFSVETIEGEGDEVLSGTLADIDGDGDLDLFEATLVKDVDHDAIWDGTQTPDPNHLYLQDDGGRFVPADDRLPEEIQDAFTFEGVWFDYDSDGDLDLYSVNDFGPEYRKNQLGRNDGTGRFEAIEHCQCRPEIHGMGGTVGDPDRDGLPDIAMTDSGPVRLYRNLGDGSFINATSLFGLDTIRESQYYWSWGILFLDIDLDGDEDLAVAMGPNQDALELGDDLPPQADLLALAEYDSHFVEAVGAGFQDTSNTRSIAMGDIDRDGHPDLVTAGFDFLKVWRTAGGCPAAVTLVLEDFPRKRNAIGSRIELEVAGETSTRWFFPGATSASSAYEVYLGFGTNPTADRVTVTWPDGAVTVAGPVPMGGTLVMAHPGAAAAARPRTIARGARSSR